MAPFWRPRLLLPLLCVALLVSGIASFDTGHHEDAVRNALLMLGYSQDAADTAALYTWFVDYYAYGNKINPSRPLLSYHFDSLFSKARAAHYWDNLVANAREEVQKYAREKNFLKYLAIMGMSLHAIEDFYAHSNWAELQWQGGHSINDTCPCFPVHTWLSTPPEHRPEPTISGAYESAQTRSELPRAPPDALQHGAYCDGINKDSYTRARVGWRDAYIYSFVASVEWVTALERWAAEANPNGFVESARSWDLPETDPTTDDEDDAVDRNSLDRELEYGYKVSLWVDSSVFSTKRVNGHWKGFGSGSIPQFGPIVAEANLRDSGFRKPIEEDEIEAPLTNNLYVDDDANLTASDRAGGVEVLPSAFNESDTAVFAIQVRTVHIRRIDTSDEADDDDADLMNSDEADMYAIISIEGQQFVETTMRNYDETDTFWTSIRFVRRNVTADGNVESETVRIQYQLFDENTAGSDTHLDIHPADDMQDLHLVLNLNTNELSAEGFGTDIYDSEERVLNATGDGDTDAPASSVQIFVRAFRLGCNHTQPSLNSTEWEALKEEIEEGEDTIATANDALPKPCMVGNYPVDLVCPEDSEQVSMALNSPGLHSGLAVVVGGLIALWVL